jgi:hypothetical protein
MTASYSRPRKSSFTIFIDWIFTTFIERAFTNARDACREMPAIACV